MFKKKIIKKKMMKASLTNVEENNTDIKEENPDEN